MTVEPRVGDVAWISRKRSARVDVHDVGGDRIVCRPEMVRRLEHEQPLRRRIDPEGGEELEPERLVSQTHDHDVDAFHVETCGVAEGHLREAVSLGPALDEVAAEALDAGCDVEGISREASALAAEPEIHCRSELSRERHANRAGVPERGNAGLAHSATEELGEHEGGVARSTSAGIVGRVGEHNRSIVTARQGMVQREVERDG